MWSRKRSPGVTTLAACACVVTAVVAGVSWRRAPTRNTPGAGARARSDVPQYVPDIAVRTQDDRRVRLYDDLVRGRVVLINFMFTTCTAFCPGATANLARVQSALGSHLGRDVLMLSVSVDPANDTPARLKAYAEKYHARDGWYFLNGSFDDVNHLRRRFRLLEPEDDPADLSAHTGVLVYGSDRRGIWRTISVLKRPADLAREVLALLN